MDYDIVIIGAGLAGAATAYYLRQQAALHHLPQPRALILEKEPTAGEHSSGRNAALVRSHLEDSALAPFAQQGAEILVTGDLAAFKATGAMLIGLGDDDVSDRFPLARGRGLWCPADGIIDVAGLLATYLDRQTVHYQTEVIDWHDAPRPTRPDGRPNLRIRTNRGPYDARIVVNAAGAWAGSLGRLPLSPTNRHLFVTPPMNTINPDWPFVWDVPHGLYFRPESGGLLLCACDETPAPPGRYDEDPQVTERLAHLVTDLQPGLGSLQIMRSWVGQRTFAPDRRFVIGFDPRDPRVFHAAALGGHGVTTSPVVGRLAADMLLHREQATAAAVDPARMLNVRSVPAYQ